MPKNPFRLPKNLELQRLKNIYKPILDKMIDVRQELKDNFYQFVLPSFADPVIIKEISLSPRFKCLFKPCVTLNKSFASKQKFIQHLTILHDQELPNGGCFIAPNDNSTKPGGFWCSKCGHHYCRRDHLQNHIKTNVHCREALILERNQLELTQNENTGVKEIEFTFLSEKKQFEFKANEILAIEWKPFEPVEPENRKKRINSLTKSFSLISISKKPKFEKKSCSLAFFSQKESNLKDLDTSVLKRKSDDLDSEKLIKNFKKEPEILKKDDNDSDDELLIKTLFEYENKNLI